jgi:hypothetical protein
MKRTYWNKRSQVCEYRALPLIKTLSSTYYGDELEMEGRIEGFIDLLVPFSLLLLWVVMGQNDNLLASSCAFTSRSWRIA